MQNIYSPNGFYLTFPHDDSGNFENFKCGKKKKNNIYAFIQIYEF